MFGCQCSSQVCSLVSLWTLEGWFWFSFPVTSHHSLILFKRKKSALSISVSVSQSGSLWLLGSLVTHASVQSPAVLLGWLSMSVHVFLVLDVWELLRAVKVSEMSLWWSFSATLIPLHCPYFIVAANFNLFLCFCRFIGTRRAFWPADKTYYLRFSWLWIFPHQLGTPGLGLRDISTVKYLFVSSRVEDSSTDADGHNADILTLCTLRYINTTSELSRSLFKLNKHQCEDNPQEKCHKMCGGWRT